MLKGYKNIEKIKQRLVEKFHPQAIVLFGSYAWGQPKEESDIDMLVVKDSQQRSRQMELEAHKLLLDIDQSLDLFVYKPEDLKAKSNAFFKRILSQGRVLYGQL